jgi:hypothetical protein
MEALFNHKNPQGFTTRIVGDKIRGGFQLVNFIINQKVMPSIWRLNFPNLLS